jgi:acid phosphatase family membrane protein YuiD
MTEILSPYIVVVIIAWIVAQGAKYLILSAKNRNINNLRQLYLSGSMPSAHSATVVSLAVLIGLREGFNSGLFGLAALLAGIVMYDAVMVRRSSGEQGVAIQQLLRDLKSDVKLPRAAKGHTPLEVLGGAGLGVVIAVVVFLATR